MKKYNITVNGNSYEVIVEEVNGASFTPAAPNFTPPVFSAPAAPAATPAAPKAAPVASSAGSNKVNAPMPGTILNVKVNVGDQVKEGDVVVILEAMKMENEICAPKSGTVAQVLTAKGSTVNTGDAMISIS